MIFDPNLILNFAAIQQKKSTYALVVLNRPILVDKELVVNLWNHSAIKILVDGGTNRWIQWLRENKLEELSHPTLITGDLDSIRSESLNYFKNSPTKVVQTMDQDETDFTKCLRVLEPHIKDKSLEYIVCICENSGRVDHILGNLNTLFKNQQAELHRQVFMLTSDSLSWLLPIGQHTIHIPVHLRKLWCSLVPIGAATRVTTTGLKWNLADHTLEFGGIVSTSNKYDGESEEVFICNDKPLLWSMGLRNDDD